MTSFTIIANITSLPVEAIEVVDRLRPTTEPTLAALEFVIAEFGFTVPVLVRKLRTGFRLIDGAHRLETMRRRGADTIPVVAVTCTDDEARVLEGSQNLAGAAMSPLDEAIFVAAFGDAYQKLHPETKRGAAGALAKHGLANELSSFAEVIGEKRSISPRQIQKIAAAGRRITKEEANQLRAATHKLTFLEVQDFGKLTNPDERAAVIHKLSLGAASSVSQARRQWVAEVSPDAEPVGESPKATPFTALMKAWQRAPLSARKRFLFEAKSEVWEAQNKGVSLDKWAEADNV